MQHNMQPVKLLSIHGTGMLLQTPVRMYSACLYKATVHVLYVPFRKHMSD